VVVLTPTVYEHPFVNPQLVDLVAGASTLGELSTIAQIRKLEGRGQDSYALNAPLAYFFDVGPNGTGQYDGTYTVTVNWGDNSQFNAADVAILPRPGLVGEVIGRHHYKHPGKYTVTLILQHGSFVSVLTLTVTVGNPTERLIEGDFESLGKRGATPEELAAYLGLIDRGALPGGGTPFHNLLLRNAIRHYLNTGQFLPA
jgi:hypothetical protein